VSKSKYLLLTIIIVLIGAFVYFDGAQYFSLTFFKTLYAENPTYTAAIFFIIYVTATALSLPGAAILTLIAGAIFGLCTGLLLVSFASSIGATMAFLVSRTLLRDWVQKKFAHYLKTINEGVAKEGAFYLFTLRLIPAVPFFVINLVMGLTPMKARTFYLVSQVGMLAGTFVYVNAGAELAGVDKLSFAGIMTPGILFSFILLAVFPYLAKAVINNIKANKVLSPYTKPKKFSANLVVIGAGSGGLVSAYIAAAVKAKVILIERHKMGGDCLNTGCVPSKALIRSARMMRYIQRCDEFGITAQGEVDFAKVMERVQRVVNTVEPHDSVERYSGLGVECRTGEARIISPYEVQLNGEIITTKNIVIASGARPLVPPIPGLDQIDYLTSDTIWNLRKRPEKLLVVGGGPIGCELAQAFARLGSKVTQVFMEPRIMFREDPDVAELVAEQFKMEGINIVTDHTFSAIQIIDGKKFAVLNTANAANPVEKNQQGETKIEFDQLLLALGRKANVTGFGLEELGIEISRQGTIVVDEYMRTKFPNIFACGDVAGPYQFTHMAAHQAWYAAVNALFGRFKKFKVDYSVVPWATFTDPEVARVGLSETEASDKGVDYEVTRFGIDDLDRAIADEENHGFIKVLTVPGKDKILGVTIVGYHAGDLLAEYVMAMKQGLGLNKILGTIHIYPTMSEANKYVAGEWKKAHKPEKLLSYVERFHQWQRS